MYGLNIIMYRTNTVNIKTVDDEVRDRDLTRKENLLVKFKRPKSTDILARIVARMSACRSDCHGNNFRKSRVSDVSARILARMSVLVSASWNASLTLRQSASVPPFFNVRLRTGRCSSI